MMETRKQLVMAVEKGRKRPKKNMNLGLHSLQEIGERFQRISAAPVEWIGTAYGASSTGSWGAT